MQLHKAWPQTLAVYNRGYGPGTTRTQIFIFNFIANVKEIREVEMFCSSS